MDGYFVWNVAGTVTCWETGRCGLKLCVACGSLEKNGHLLGNRQVWIETVKDIGNNSMQIGHLLGNRQVWIETCRLNAPAPDPPRHLLGNRQVWIETPSPTWIRWWRTCHLLGNRQVWIETRTARSCPG